MVGLIVLISLLECFVPRQSTSDTLKLRWIGNFAFLILGALTARLVLPLFGLAWAIYCAEHGWGLFNQLALPGWFKGLATFFVLDVVIYSRHWLAHQSPLLWRLHRLHHTDNDIDFTTTFRFHPLDALFIVVVDIGVIALLGVPPAGFLIFHLVSTLVDFTSHANVKLPLRFDRFVRRFVITPDMHRIHHSLKIDESRTKYGNVLPIWDRWLGTYRAEPEAGHAQLKLGLSEFSERKHQSLPWMLAQPFLSEPSAVPAEDRAIAGSRI